MLQAFYSVPSKGLSGRAEGAAPQQPPPQLSHNRVLQVLSSLLHRTPEAHEWPSSPGSFPSFAALLPSATSGSCFNQSGPCRGIPAALGDRLGSRWETSEQGGALRATAHNTARREIKTGAKASWGELVFSSGPSAAKTPRGVHETQRFNCLQVGQVLRERGWREKLLIM